MNQNLGNITSHSHYSLLCAAPKIKDLVIAAKEKGFNVIGLTDTNNMYGAIEFYKQCKKLEMKPIIGSSVFVKSGDRFARLNLIAKNINGYRNLSKIVTECQKNGLNDKFPNINLDYLAEKSEDIIAIAPVINGPIARHKGDIKDYKNIFKDNLYLGIGVHDDIYNYNLIKKQSIEEANKHGIKQVIAQLNYFINEDDSEVRGILLKIKENSSDEILEEYFTDANLSMLTKEEMINSFDKETIENTERTIESINLEIPMDEYIFPKAILGESPEETLHNKVFDEFKKKGFQKDKIAKERIDYELDIINKKGYAPYFLTVIDIVDHMHKEKILTTTRGSSSGSFVAFLTEITNVNPIENNLPFERFLNPFRPSAPDIDLDIADDKRDSVIDYIIEKFGKANVAQIGTFGTMKARAVVRDVARALGYPYVTGDRIAKLIPFGKQGFPMTIEKALRESEGLSEMYERDGEVKRIIDLSKKIEGNVRHISKHAAGVVISPDDITNYLPLQPDGGENNKMITQFDMHAIESIGLIKFDILGLTNLSILEDVVNRVNKKYKKNINLNEIAFDDKKTYQLLSTGKLAGIFQLGGSSGIKSLSKKLEPSSLDDISAIIALYRPGPIQNIDKYIERKHGKEKVEYIHPSMKKYLDKSYGILVYQDDILFTAIELAGYDWKEVDILRKAIGKKIPELMKSEHENFVKKCSTFSNIKKSKAEKIWKLFEPFQGYGFNKAHAAAYAKVAYQTAYMKANYPEEYMASLLTAEMGDVDKISDLSRECKILDIKILPPNVNKSHSEFITSEKPNEILTGLGVIKNLGKEIASEIVEERKSAGPYTSISDFISRVGGRTPINRRFLEALVKSGCLDEFEDRHKLISNLDLLVKYAKDCAKSSSSQQSLFSEEVTSPEIQLEESNQIGIEQKLFWERDFTGMYMSSHPLKYYKRTEDTIEAIKKKRDESRVEDATVIISDLKRVRTRNGNNVTFVILEDQDDVIEGVVFSDIYNLFEELLAKNRCVQLCGKVSHRNGSISLVIDKVKDPELIRS